MGSFAGPNIIKDSLYNYHICITSGTFTPNFSGNIEVLVVAGGGGGGMDMGGGGGGGGVLSSASYAVTAGTGITVTIGAGGVGAPPGGYPLNNTYHQFWVSATQGGNSVFGSLTAVGGGYGGSSYFGYTPNNGYGGNGGSGGGASGYSDGNTGRGGAGTAGQGNNGGGAGGQYYSGGGGGAGAVGASGTAQANGGAGVLNSILGRDLYWGGGGGGAAYSLGTGGNGGIGGGGGGAIGVTTGGTGYNNGDPGSMGYSGTQANSYGGNGGQNTGGGGGGGSHYNSHNHGGNGGSGIVIIRYLKTLGTSTFNTSGAVNQNSLILSLDAANIGKGSAVEVLVVAGGGGGGVDMGGGGGAGGLIYKTAYPVKTNEAITVTIGGGGAGATGYASNPSAGSSGGNTVFGNLIALGGGGGGSGHYIYAPYAGQQGQKGGSGGGDSPLWGRVPQYPTSIGTTGQGYGGGGAQGWGDGNYRAGGGGGASQPGGGGGNSYGGNGGQGFLSAINGTSLYWAGGGGGSIHDGATGGNGGAGGGGGGSAWDGYTAGTGGAGLNAGGNGTLWSAGASGAGGAGGANTGGGGGGGCHQRNGGAGGSGIVIVRYYGAQKATGGTITSSGGYTIHTFTSSGTFTPTGFLDISDTGGSELKGTVVGATYSSDNGGTFNFNASSVITVPMATLRPTTQITQECWFSTTTNAAQVFIGSQYGTSSNNSYAIWLNAANTWAGGVNIAGTFTVQTYTSTINTNTYYHFVHTYDGSNQRLYINGENVATLATTGVITYDTNNTLLAIGNDWNGTGYNTGASMGVLGKLPIAKIYNRALSAAEVKQNFQALRGRFGI